MISNITLSDKKEFDDLYLAWKIKRDKLLSNPIIKYEDFVKSKEYEIVLKWLKSKNKSFYGLLFEKFIEGDEWCRFLIRDLTFPDYSHYLKQIKEENANNLYDVNGVYIIREAETNAIKYLKKILKHFAGNNSLKPTITTIYPNPSEDIIKFNISLNAPSYLSLYIVDKDGNIIKTLFESSLFKDGEYLFEWDGTSKNGKYVHSGVYFIKVSINSNVELFKVLINK